MLKLQEKSWIYCGRWFRCKHACHRQGLTDDTDATRSTECDSKAKAFYFVNNERNIGDNSTPSWLFDLNNAIRRAAVSTHSRDGICYVVRPWLCIHDITEKLFKKLFSLRWTPVERMPFLQRVTTARQCKILAKLTM